MTVNFNEEILIPVGNVGDFAVVACDQFAADPEYWNNLKIQLSPLSALDLILPECFLSEAPARIVAIRQAAERMDREGRFNAYNGCVYVTRSTKYGRVRHGIVASVDLSDYNYKAGSTSLIRASERTLEDRIPPRVQIREAINIELPHIILLVDDRDDLLMSACRKAKKHCLYDGELKSDGGRVKGELISDTAELYSAVESIVNASFGKYGEKLFALVGDGNHSLATAKYCSIHNPTVLNNRALAEIVNIYDEGMVFEPIHRLVRVEDVENFIRAFRSEIKGEAKSILVADSDTEINVPEDPIDAIKIIDEFCEAYVKESGGSVEYVHGDGALKKSGCVGIKMRGISKPEFFGYVVKNGVLPKKTFSLGEAEEKRYYVEARKIK